MGVSEQAEGPGWWLASDGRWYPPELHPSATAPPPPPITPTPAPAAASAKVLTLIGAAGAILGAFLPWATITVFVTISKNGIDGDGAITLVLGVVLAIVAVLEKSPVLQVLAAGLITAVALFDTVDVRASREDGFGASVGIGLWMTLAAGVVALVGSIQQVRRR